MQLATGTNKGHTTGNMQSDSIPQAYQSPDPFDDVSTSHYTLNAYHQACGTSGEGRHIAYLKLFLLS